MNKNSVQTIKFGFVRTRLSSFLKPLGCVSVKTFHISRSLQKKLNVIYGKEK